MDYCSSCRRHLNGALACPGCGAYAPDIAPRGTGATVWRTPADNAWQDPEPDPYDPYARETVEEAAEDPYGGPDAAPPAPVGRAARRRQRARWKKNQRRAVVATAVALVGGGLSVASLNRHTADRAQAAAAPDNQPMGVTGGQATDATDTASTPTGRHRAPEGTPSARATTANAPHEQTAGVPHATPTPRRATVASARPTATSSAAPQSVATASGSGTTATQSEPAATPTATATGSTQTPAASPSPAATSPSQLCLLVICLG